MKKADDVFNLFLQKAHQDLIVAKKLFTDKEISDEIIGFHIQQAIEKCLKALLSLKSIPFRRTHDIRELMDLICDKIGRLPDQFNCLDELTLYAVELRYDDIPVDIPPLDRQAAIDKATNFYEWVHNYRKSIE